MSQTLSSSTADFSKHQNFIEELARKKQLTFNRQSFLRWLDEKTYSVPNTKRLLYRLNQNPLKEIDFWFATALTFMGGAVVNIAIARGFEIFVNTQGFTAAGFVFVFGLAALEAFALAIVLYQCINRRNEDHLVELISESQQPETLELNSAIN